MREVALFLKCLGASVALLFCGLEIFIRILYKNGSMSIDSATLMIQYGFLVVLLGFSLYMASFLYLFSAKRKNCINS